MGTSRQAPPSVVWDRRQQSAQEHRFVSVAPAMPASASSAAHYTVNEPPYAAAPTPVSSMAPSPFQSSSFASPHSRSQVTLAPTAPGPSSSGHHQWLHYSPRPNESKQPGFPPRIATEPLQQPMPEARPLAGVSRSSPEIKVESQAIPSSKPPVDEAPVSDPGKMDDQFKCNATIDEILEIVRGKTAVNRMLSEQANSTSSTSRSISPEQSLGVGPLVGNPTAPGRRSGQPRRKGATYPASDSAQQSFKCPFLGCGKTFKRRGTLSTHEISHTGERPFPCTFPGCTKTCSQKGNLKTHMRAHLGERPFKCEECGMPFSASGGRIAHRKIHDPNRILYPCKLDQCQKLFTTPGNLKVHQGRDHHEYINWLKARAETNPESLTKHDLDALLHLHTTHKHSNRGIKGRGRGRYVSPPDAPRLSERRTHRRRSSSIGSSSVGSSSSIGSSSGRSSGYGFADSWCSDSPIYTPVSSPASFVGCPSPPASSPSSSYTGSPMDMATPGSDYGFFGGQHNQGSPQTPHSQQLPHSEHLAPQQLLSHPQSPMPLYSTSHQQLPYHHKAQDSSLLHGQGQPHPSHSFGDGRPASYSIPPSPAPAGPYAVGAAHVPSPMYTGGPAVDFQHSHRVCQG